MSDLQQFVIKFFTTLGAVIEEVDYALIEVLIDDEFKETFGKTELKLCFDYEVYLENPKYDLVTFGSFILDKIINLSLKLSNTSIRYVTVSNLNVAEADKKIKKFLKLDRTDIEIIDEKIFIDYFVKYSFKMTYISDNTIEEFEDVVVDMKSISVSNKFYDNLNGIFYESKPQYDYSLNTNINFLEGLKEGLKEIDKIKEFKIVQLGSQSIINKEIKRINLYYDLLKSEAEKRMSRKNLSEEKVNEYKHKIKIYDMEKQRQLNEITEKYRVKSNAFLQNAVVYAVPMIGFKYRILGRNNSNEESMCFYNTVLKEFETPGVEN